MSEVALIGGAMSPLTKLMEKNSFDLVSETIHLAIRDAGIERSAVDGLAVTPPGMAGHNTSMFVSRLGAPLGGGAEVAGLFGERRVQQRARPPVGDIRSPSGALSGCRRGGSGPAPQYDARRRGIVGHVLRPKRVRDDGRVWRVRRALRTWSPHPLLRNERAALHVRNRSHCRRPGLGRCSPARTRTES